MRRQRVTQSIEQKISDLKSELTEKFTSFLEFIEDGNIKKASRKIKNIMSSSILKDSMFKTKNEQNIETIKKFLSENDVINELLSVMKDISSIEVNEEKLLQATTNALLGIIEFSDKSEENDISDYILEGLVDVFNDVNVPVYAKSTIIVQLLKNKVDASETDSIYDPEIIRRLGEQMLLSKGVEEKDITKSNVYMTALNFLTSKLKSEQFSDIKFLSRYLLRIVSNYDKNYPDELRIAIIKVLADTSNYYNYNIVLEDGGLSVLTGLQIYDPAVLKEYIKLIDDMIENFSIGHIEIRENIGLIIQKMKRISRFNGEQYTEIAVLVKKLLKKIDKKSRDYVKEMLLMDIGNIDPEEFYPIVVNLSRPSNKDLITKDSINFLVEMVEKISSKKGGYDRKGYNNYLLNTKTILDIVSKIFIPLIEPNEFDSDNLIAIITNALSKIVSKIFGPLVKFDEPAEIDVNVLVEIAKMEIRNPRIKSIIYQRILECFKKVNVGYITTEVIASVNTMIKNAVKIAERNNTKVDLLAEFNKFLSIIKRYDGIDESVKELVDSIKHSILEDIENLQAAMRENREQRFSQE